MLIKVKDHPNLRKDNISGAIINIDESQRKYIKQKKTIESKKIEKLTCLENRISQLENDSQDIKRLLQIIIGKLS